MKVNGRLRIVVARAEPVSVPLQLPDKGRLQRMATVASDQIYSSFDLGVATGISCHVYVPRRAGSSVAADGCKTRHQIHCNNNIFRETVNLVISSGPTADLMASGRRRMSRTRPTPDGLGSHRIWDPQLFSHYRVALDFHSCISSVSMLIASQVAVCR